MKKYIISELENKYHAYSIADFERVCDTFTCTCIIAGRLRKIHGYIDREMNIHIS